MSQKSNSRSLCTVLLAAAVLLTLVSQSAWAARKEKLLLRFDVGDGSLPVASMIADAAGNLYGTTYNGGVFSGCKNQGCGIVFQLTPLKNGKWAEKILHKFQPNGSDSAGNLYGTTELGGDYIGPCSSTADAVQFLRSRRSPKVQGGCLSRSFICGTPRQL